MINLTVDAARLWDAHMEMARIGATAEGGSSRLALTAEDRNGRALLESWCAPIGLRFERDAIGNMFFKREGTDPGAKAIAFGSHLDTVPAGGRFDGIFGVLAGLEIMRSLHQAGHATRAPLELVNWTNEESSRFQPGNLGSRVHAGKMSLADALAIRDDNGVSVEEALRESQQAGELVPAPRNWSFWLEAHIEQGAILEQEGIDVGIVTGTVQARYFWITVTGESSHVGPTTMDRRRDSLAASAEIILLIEGLGKNSEPRGRASASWIINEPNSAPSVSGLTRLQVDVRHEEVAHAVAMEQELRSAIVEIASRRGVAIEVDHYATFGRVDFDPALRTLLHNKAMQRQFTTRDIVAPAGHDAILVADTYPSAMLFVPSKDGITHNPKEFSSKEELALGAQVLLDAVLDLAK